MSSEMTMTAEVLPFYRGHAKHDVFSATARCRGQTWLMPHMEEATDAYA